MSNNHYAENATLRLVQQQHQLLQTTEPMCGIVERRLFVKMDKSPDKPHQDSNLNLQAKDEFDKGNYGKCLAILDEVAASSNIVVLKHNRAVAEFYRSGCIDTETLFKTLDDLDLESADKPKSTFPSIVKYNKAVVQFHRHLFRGAIDTLAPLLNKLDAMEEGHAALVGVLMLRLLLATNQFNKAQAFLEFLQVQLGLNSDILPTDDSNGSEKSANVDAFTWSFKLLALLTNVTNNKAFVVPEDGSPELSAIKAYQYYITKDFQRAAKQLEKIKVENLLESDEFYTCLANNMGVIHLRVRHYAIAAQFFKNAITFDKEVTTKLRKVSLYRRSAVRSCEVLYNMGIALLHLRRPREAFQCFLVPLKSYHSNPRLWFRTAEACIMDYEMENNKDKKSPSFEKNHNESSAYTSGNSSAAVPEINLDFAALCLRNALKLTEAYKRKFYVPEPEGADTENITWRQIRDNNFCNPSPPITRESLEKLLASIYAAYSYVALRLADYVTALRMARELLITDNLSDAHRMLGQMYAGEALLMLDRFADAQKYFDPNFVSSLNAFDFETKDWQVKSLDAAQNVVRYNCAVAKVMQNEYASAKIIVTSCDHPIVASQAASLIKFLDKKMQKPVPKA